MKTNQLTEEELSILHQMSSAGKWETLNYDLTLLVPTMLIASYGIWKADALIGAIGIGLYVVLRLKVSFQQDRMMEPLQSGIRKLLQARQTEAGEQGSDSPAKSQTI